MTCTVETIGTAHVDLVSSKDFETTARDLEAELGRASTGEMMERLAHAAYWDDYAAQCGALAGRSGLIEVGHLDWGAVLTLSGIALKARCFIIGNPLTAQKLLAAGMPAAGLYLPTKILVFEASDQSVHVAYDRLAPILARFANDQLGQIAVKIDGVLHALATVAAS